MRSISLHEDATARTLAGARILVGLTWVVRLLPDPVARLGFLPEHLWFGQGVMALIPDAVVGVLTTSLALSLFKWVGITLSIWVILGTRGARTALLVLTICMVLYLGLTKGFGGHVNHRELVLLYTSTVLLLTPCLDALAIHREQPASGLTGVYQASMLSLCLTIAISYMFIGWARVAIGFPGVFDPDVMAAWLMDRAVRPNPVGSNLGQHLLSLPGSRFLIATMLPISTALELSAPAMLWLRKSFRYLVIVGLAVVHVAILLFMNIVFVESILLLLLFFDYTPLVEKAVSISPRVSSRGSGRA